MPLNSLDQMRGTSNTVAILAEQIPVSASRVCEGRRSQFGPFHHEAVLLVPGGGVEPPSRASKARVLPLDDPGPGLIIQGRPQTELS